MDFIDKLKEVKEKFENINEKLSDPEVVSNQELLIKLSKERSDLMEVVEAYDKYNEVMSNIEGNREIIDSGDESELVEMAEEELEELNTTKTELEEKIKVLLIPKDPDDDKDVILEIRAGTGGEEAGLFAADLLRMYTRFSKDICSSSSLA